MSQRVEAALFELQQYLQDEIPPSSAADAVATLMAQPPDVVMQRVASWSAEQSRARSMPVSDLLLHALKKVYVTGELRLLHRDAVADYLDRVTTVALHICPVEERDRLRSSVTAMRASGDTAARLESPRMRIPTLTGTTPLVLDDEAQTAKRFSLIFDRLKHDVETGGEQAMQAEPQALAQLLTMAASRSQTGQQFNDYMTMLRPLTGGKEGNVFVILGGAVPSWDLPSLAPGTVKPPAQVTAMEKIIDLAEDPHVAIKRFRELVVAAVEKFNDGSLAAAVWMLDVAEDTITEKKFESAAVDPIRAEAADAISSVQLRKYTENKTKHAAMRLALNFFPTLHLETVLRQLRGEARAERRRTLLGIIEAYGALGRNAALARLDGELRRADVDTYYLRNLIFLLHRIPRETGEDAEHELASFTQASAPGQNIFVIKEAATGLGQIKTESSAKVLTTRLAEFELTLLRNDTSSYPAAEMQKLLDRIIAALARIGTPGALLTIARHGMKANPPLGDTRARLAALAQHDLSFDEPTVNVLLKALREDIPGKLFGRLLPKRQDATVRLIEALSGTRAEAVEDVFTDIAQRFADQDVGRAAAQVLEKWSPTTAASREPVATLTGELEFFGLPSVMQSLGEMRATGMLTLRTKQGQAAAKLAVSDGKFLNAQRGSVRGPDALYDMLERPISGTFAFVSYPPEKMKSDEPTRDMIGLLLEGVRRHDELQRMLALLPDDIKMAKTTVRPTPHEEEDDPAFIRDVWLKASSGAPIGQWERELNTDSYRVRRIVAHWLEQGALIGA
jgi:Domain of unknown function (DUF4388)